MKVKTYTKKDVVRRTAEALDTKLVDTAEIVDGVFMVLREMLSESDPRIRIEIRNFGVFEVKPTKAKPKARNPRTKRRSICSARRKTHFKPGRLLKERMKKA